MRKIFIIEDEKNIANELKQQLFSWGYNTDTAKDFKRIIEELKEYNPDIVLMDINLPYLNGFIWCEKIREFSNVPIIFLTSAYDNINLVTAINHGGDDFLPKPFEIQVLVAKIKALLRRTYEFEEKESILEYDNVKLNTDNMTVSYNGKMESLSKNEFMILETLMENTNKVISRDRIMDKIWNTNSFIDDNTLTVNITRLRRKLENLGIEDFIKTKKGVGYMIRWKNL